MLLEPRRINADIDDSEYAQRATEEGLIAKDEK